MTTDKVKFRIEDRVGIISLDDPPGNGTGLAVTERILDLLDQCEKDDDVRCVMLTHEGPDFSAAGASEDEMPYMSQGMEIAEIARIYRPSGLKLIERIDQYPKPTLSAGMGHCHGAGSVIFQCCDIRIAGESFELYDANLYWGCASDWGMITTRMPIWLGRNKVMDYLFLDEVFKARQLYEMGIVSKVVPDSVCKEVGLIYAKKMATAAPLSVRYAKECVRRAVYRTDVNELVRQEIEAAEIVLASEDARKGTKQAAMYGTKYDFKGR